MLQVREVELSKLKPWEDNPRLNDQAVDTVARSIPLCLPVHNERLHDWKLSPKSIICQRDSDFNKEGTNRSIPDLERADTLYSCLAKISEGGLAYNHARCPL